MAKVDHWLYVIALFILPLPFVYLVVRSLLIVLGCTVCRDEPGYPGALVLAWSIPLFALYCVCAAIWVKRKRQVPFLAWFYATIALLYMANAEYHAFFGQ